MYSSSTEMLLDSQAARAQAAEILARGGLVAFPTETVYGLGANACNDVAVAKIFEAKGRPQFNPLIVHVRDVKMAQRFVELSEAAQALADAFWPGPLTLVLPLKEGSGLSPLVTAGLETVAIRIPAHPSATGLLEAFQGPIAAPSANPSGRISPTRADHVVDGLLGKIDAILDGGACSVGLESTILGFDPAPALLRAGGVPVEDIERVLGQSVQRHVGDAITAPGQLASHYAPNAKVRLNAKSSIANEVLLGFGEVQGDLSLSPTGDLIEAAASLFHHLRQADSLGRPIAVAPIPESGLGLAINDRLRRAAAPRD